MATKLEVEIELKNPAEKVWSNLKKFATLFPKVLPHLYRKIDVLEGDGKSIGSILSITFKLSKLESKSKVRIEIVDDTKKVLSYTFIDGQNLNSKVIISVRSNNGGGVITITTEFDKANSQIPTPEFYREQHQSFPRSGCISSQGMID